MDWRFPLVFGLYGLVVGIGAGELSARVPGPLHPALYWLGLFLPIFLYPSFSVAPFWARLREGRLRSDAACFGFLLAIAGWRAAFAPAGWPALAFTFCLCLAFLAVWHGLRQARSDAWTLGALAVLWLPFEFGWLGRMFVPGARGLDLLPVLLLDAGLFLFLVFRGLDGVGFDFRLTWKDAGAALKEFLLLAPVLLVLGWATGFIHWDPKWRGPLAEGLRPLGIYFLNALPEEFLFRGVMQNLLARRLGTRKALAVTAVVFGLSHVENTVGGFTLPNWRYVLMATAAGWCYGRAYLKTGKVTASALVHTCVNWTWSVLFHL